MIIYGINPVLEAIRSAPERIHYIAVAREEQARLKKLVDEARRAGVSVRQMPLEQVRRMSGGRVHNGVVADVSAASYADFDDLLDREPSFVLILDGVQDPQNLGAILRVADGFGVDFVVIPEHESVGLTPGAVKASAGASEWVPVAQVTNLSRAIEKLQKEGFWVYAAAAEGDPLTSIDFSGKVALVMGNEEKGVRRNVLEHCDKTVSIPMRGKVSSFNVATATAVLCWEVVRGR